MGARLPLFPEQASTLASQTDYLFYYLLAVAIFFSAGIFLAIFYFAIKYRRRSEADIPAPASSLSLELLWSGIPFVLVMIMFAWGAKVYLFAFDPPANAEEIWVVGKQWMWKVQHPEGQREINELHVAAGRPVKLTMISQDVIHSFYIPSFRTKMDVLPGRYTTLWFQPTQTGKFHLFCAEYCGTEHSGMIGWVYVMEPQDYQTWLSGGRAEGSLAARGQKLFQDLGCAACHVAQAPGGRESAARAPSLMGLFGTKVKLADGSTVTADEAYIRESILNPSAKIVAGYMPIMPTFQGLVTEEGLLSLVEYIKSLGAQTEAAPPLGSGTTTVLRRQEPRDRATEPSTAGTEPQKR